MFFLKVRGLTSAYPEDRQRALRRLERDWSDKATNAIVSVLNDSDYQVSRLAAQILRERRWAQTAHDRAHIAVRLHRWDEAAAEGAVAVPMLEGALQDCKWNAINVKEIVSALAHVKDRAAIPSLLALLRDEATAYPAGNALLIDIGAIDEFLQEMTVRPNEGFVIRSFLNALSSARLKLRNQDGPVLYEQIFKLGRGGDSRRTLAAAIIGTGWMPTAAEERIELAIAAGEYQTAAREGAAAVSPLSAELEKLQSYFDLGRVIQALATIPDPKAIGCIAKYLSYRSRFYGWHHVREEAVVALGKVDNGSAASALIQLVANCRNNDDPSAKKAVGLLLDWAATPGGRLTQNDCAGILELQDHYCWSHQWGNAGEADTIEIDCAFLKRHARRLLSASGR